MQTLTLFLADHWLDILTTILGLVYVVLEYRASIALWIVGIVMPALDIYLYWSHGLYGDAGMAVYYTLAAVYGYAVWKFGRKRSGTASCAMPITHFPKRLILPTLLGFATVPLLDSFTNAMSFVGLWALARKYIEQWVFWIAVDAISCYLYVVKGIPFKAGLYGLYVVIAVMGYFKWQRMMHDGLALKQEKV